MANKEDKAQEDVTTEPALALLIELETAGYGARDLTYAALAKTLASKDATLTPVLFARYCRQFPLQEEAVTELLSVLGKARLSVPKLLDEVRASVENTLREEATEPDPDIVTLLRAALRQDFVIGVVSSLSKKTLNVLVERLADASGATIASFASGSERHVFGAEAWLKLCRQMNVDPMLSIAITSSNEASVGALSSKIRVVARPDKFTEFEDFCGSDFVCEGLTRTVIRDILSLVEVE